VALKTHFSVLQFIISHVGHQLNAVGYQTTNVITLVKRDS